MVTTELSIIQSLPQLGKSYEKLLQYVKYNFNIKSLHELVNDEKADVRDISHELQTQRTAIADYLRLFAIYLVDLKEHNFILSQQELVKYYETKKANYGNSLLKYFSLDWWLIDIKIRQIHKSITDYQEHMRDVKTVGGTIGRKAQWFDPSGRFKHWENKRNELKEITNMAIFMIEKRRAPSDKKIILQQFKETLQVRGFITE